ncbi:hypothetical protein HYT57_04425 [Candidatus Woesearchaeota archaeon]|nr:hypothetical protein [Candidatus Woesearchaeota archaeon]
MADWRNKVDPALRDYLEAQVRETNLHKNAYNSAKNQANAQLWIAIAVLSKQLFNMNMKLNVLEDALKEINNKVMSAKEMPVYREEKVETPVAVKEVKTEKKTVKKASKPKIVKKKANIKKSLRRF